MKEDSMLKCLIAFILGWIILRMIGDGFRVGGDIKNNFHPCSCPGGNAVKENICTMNQEKCSSCTIDGWYLTDNKL